MCIYIYNTRTYTPTPVRVCVRVKPEREQHVLPLSTHSFRISHVFLFFFEKFPFFQFFQFFFNGLSKNIYVTLERSNFSRFNTRLRQLLLFFQRRRFRLLVFFNGKRKKERECVRIRWCAAFVLSAFVFV